MKTTTRMTMPIVIIGKEWGEDFFFCLLAINLSRFELI
jgi:hypothetical protein